MNNDVLIVPSLWDEPFGRIVIVGSMFGLPMIGGNIGGMPEIINNLGSGEIFDLNCDGKLRKAIEKFTERNNIIPYIKRIMKNLDHYSSESKADEFIKIYEEIKTWILILFMIILHQLVGV